MIKTPINSKKVALGVLCIVLFSSIPILLAQQPSFNRKPIDNPYRITGEWVEGREPAILDAKAKAFEVALYQDAEFYQFRVLSMRAKGRMRQAEVEISWK